MRTLEYTLTVDDGAMSVRRVLKEKLRLSNKEISHAKNFEDGIRAELDIKNETTLRDRLHTDSAYFCRDKAGQRNKYDDRVKDKGSDRDIKEPKKAMFNEDGIRLFRVTVNETLYPGERLTVTLHEIHDDEGKILPVPGEIDILYEDDDIIALNKPPGIVSHPSPGHRDDSLSNRLAYYFEQKNEPHRIRIIGRLDKDASGVLLFAKTRMAARALRSKVGSAYDKEYIALCNGVFGDDQKEGTINLPILKRPEIILKREVSSDGERAVTHYKVLEQGKEAALLCLKLETGRTHQIRVHMAAIGHPLVGDLIYSDYCANKAYTRAMLHARTLSIIHPVTGQKLVFSAPVPADMIQAAEGFGLQVPNSCI